MTNQHELLRPAAAMTQAELDALPEMGGFDVVEKIINGMRIRVPVARPVRALWTADDEPCAVIDSHGCQWRIGWADGVRWKVRADCREEPKP